MTALAEPGGARWGYAVNVAGAGALSFAVAVAAAFYPMPAAAAALGLIPVFVIVHRPLLMLSAFAATLGVPVHLGVPVNAADGLLTGWALCLPFILVRMEPGRWRMPILVPAILPFTVVVALGTALAQDPAGNPKQLARIVEWFVVLPLVLSGLALTPRALRIVAVLMLLLPCAFAIDGMVEYLTHGQSLSRMIGIPVPAPEDTSSSTIHHTFDVSGRAGSTFGGAQGLAMFIVMLMSVGVAHVARAPSGGLRAGAALSILVCTGGLVAAMSRGGMVGAGVMVAVILMLEVPRLAAWSGFAAVLGAAVAIPGLAMWSGWDGTLAGLVPGRSAAVLDRLSIWRMALDVWSDNPFLGVGLGNFRDHAIARHIELLVPLGRESFHAHSTYLELLADTGLLGLGAYLGFLFFAATRLVRLWARLRGTRHSHGSTFVLAGLGALAAYAVFASVDMLLLENMHMVLLLLLTLGLAGGTASLRNPT